jgi:hypothetical protein
MVGAKTPFCRSKNMNFTKKNFNTPYFKKITVRMTTLGKRSSRSDEESTADEPHTKVPKITESKTQEPILKNVLIRCVNDRDNMNENKYPWPITGVYQKEVDEIAAQAKDNNQCGLGLWYESRKSDFTIGHIVKVEVKAITDTTMVCNYHKDKSGAAVSVNFTLLIPEINGNEPVLFEEGHWLYDAERDEDILPADFSEVSVPRHPGYKFTFELDYKYQHPKMEALCKQLYQESKNKQETATIE